MRRLFFFACLLLLLLNLLEPLLLPQARPAWPGRVADSAGEEPNAWPAGSDSAGQVHSDPLPAATVDGRPAAPDIAPFREGLLHAPAVLIPILPGGDNPVTRLLFRGLARLGADGIPRPDLAAAWEERGGTDWLVHIRPDLRWHDGQPLTATDAVFTFSEAVTALQDLDGTAWDVEEARRRARLWARRRVEAVDPQTIRITLDQPDFSLPYDLSLPLLPAHLLRGTGSPAAWVGADFGRSPVGSGPFRLTEWSEDGISLEAFDQGGLWPRLRGYRFLPLQSEDEAWQALQAGKLDGVLFERPPALVPPNLLVPPMAPPPPAPALGAAEIQDRVRRLGLQLYTWPTTDFLALLWSEDTDPALRRALLPALADGGLRPPYPTEAAGTVGAPTDLAEAQVLADRLRALGAGVALVPDPLGHGPSVQGLAGHGPSGEGLSGRILLWHAGADPDLANLLGEVPGGAPDLTRLAWSARAEVDAGRRRVLVRELAGRLQAEGLIVPLARGRRFFVTRGPIGGFLPNPYDMYLTVSGWLPSR